MGTISVVPAVTRETAIMQIKEEIARIEREKNKLFETLMQIEVDFQRWGIEPTGCRPAIERTISKCKLEVANLESQLHDAADIEYIEMKMGTASFEESATIYHIDLHDGIRSFERGGPAVTLAKKIGQVSHKLTFGLLN